MIVENKIKLVTGAKEVWYFHRVTLVNLRLYDQFCYKLMFHLSTRLCSKENVFKLTFHARVCRCETFTTCFSLFVSYFWQYIFRPDQ